MGIPARERITMITFDETRNKMALCKTYNKAWIKRLDALCESKRDDFKLISQEPDGSKSYSFPKRYLKVYTPRNISPEYKSKIVERMKKLRAEGKIR